MYKSKSVVAFFLLLLLSPFGVSLGQANIVHTTNINDASVTASGSRMQVISKLGQWDTKSNQCKTTRNYVWYSSYTRFFPVLYIATDRFPLDSEGKPYTCVINYYRAHPAQSDPNKVSNVATDRYKLYARGNAYISSSPVTTKIVITYP